MAGLVKRWEPRSRFGDLAVVGFLLMQCLDGMFTYLGIGIWGLTIEANPLISSAMAALGVVAGLGTAKGVAIGLGMMLPQENPYSRCPAHRHLLHRGDPAVDDLVPHCQSVVGSR